MFSFAGSKAVQKVNLGCQRDRWSFYIANLGFRTVTTEWVAAPEYVLASDGWRFVCTSVTITNSITPETYKLSSLNTTAILAKCWPLNAPQYRASASYRCVKSREPYSVACTRWSARFDCASTQWVFRWMLWSIYSDGLSRYSEFNLKYALGEHRISGPMGETVKWVRQVAHLCNDWLQISALYRTVISCSNTVSLHCLLLMRQSFIVAGIR